MSDRVDKIPRKLLWIHQAQKCDIRIEARNDSVATVFTPIENGYATHSSISGENPRNRRFDLNFGPSFFRRGSDGVRQPTHPAPHISPNSPHPVALAHHVMEQHVCR